MMAQGDVWSAIRRRISDDCILSSLKMAIDATGYERQSAILDAVSSQLADAVVAAELENLKHREGG